MRRWSGAVDRSTPSEWSEGLMQRRIKRNIVPVRQLWRSTREGATRWGRAAVAGIRENRHRQVALISGVGGFCLLLLIFMLVGGGGAEQSKDAATEGGSDAETETVAASDSGSDAEDAASGSEDLSAGGTEGASSSDSNAGAEADPESDRGGTGSDSTDPRDVPPVPDALASEEGPDEAGATPDSSGDTTSADRSSSMSEAASGRAGANEPVAIEVDAPAPGRMGPADDETGSDSPDSALSDASGEADSSGSQETGTAAENAMDSPSESGGADAGIAAAEDPQRDEPGSDETPGASDGDSDAMADRGSDGSGSSTTADDTGGSSTTAEADAGESDTASEASEADGDDPSEAEVADASSAGDSASGGSSSASGSSGSSSGDSGGVIPHTVRKGETFASIAKRFYGDESKWTAIVEANPGIDPQQLSVGQQIKLPPGEGLRSKAGSGDEDADQEAPDGSERIVTVDSGDSIFGIARRVYGNGRHWRRIYEANEERLDSPDQLPVGMKLKVPPRDE
jgi:nucleoid-associated protein YgaU